MKILIDRHHADLLYSLQLLFEDRLGFQLFVTMGHEWWDEGYWRFGEVFGDDRLAQQYLNPDAQYREVAPGAWLTFDPCHPERPIYCVSVELARILKFDFVLASVQENQSGFHRFAEEVGAGYLYQVGNTCQGIDYSLEPVVLNSSSAPITNVLSVNIGQEFDARAFRYRDPVYFDRVTSFVNLLPRIPESQAPFEELKQHLPSFQFRSYGHDCPDGFLKPIAAVAEEMSLSTWAYHDKPTGDGFGHVIHNWASIGRPLIGHGQYYAGQRASRFWQDLVTCIDLDKHSVAEAAELISKMSIQQYYQMCRKIRHEFEMSYNPQRAASDVARVINLLKDRRKHAAI